jgi:hypothetical protein
VQERPGEGRPFAQAEQRPGRGTRRYVQGFDQRQAAAERIAASRSSGLRQYSRFLTSCPLASLTQPLRVSRSRAEWIVGSS